MKKLLLGAIAGLSMACAPFTASAQDVDPALWEIHDADTTIYLFGTVHAMHQGLGWFDEAVRTAFDASDELRLEMVEPPAAELQALVGELALRSDGRTLTETLPPERRADFAAALARVGLPANGLDRFEPWFATVMLSGMMLPVLGYDPTQGADHLLAEAAASEGKTVSGFETAREQLGLFDGADEAAQIGYLLSVVDDLGGLGPKIERITTLWGEGRPDALGEAMNDELRATPEFADRLLTQRNRRWADWIAARMAQPGTVFVAVGAGHLGGNDNVRTMLEARGLHVERIEY